VTSKLTKEIIDRIFREPGIKYELTDFESLGKPIHEILTIYPKTAETGRDAGKTKYYLKSFIPFLRAMRRFMFTSKVVNQPRRRLCANSGSIN
jgi:hypothetical protein